MTFAPAIRLTDARLDPNLSGKVFAGESFGPGARWRSEIELLPARRLILLVAARCAHAATKFRRPNQPALATDHRRGFYREGGRATTKSVLPSNSAICARAFSEHGYAGIEEEAVREIAAFILGN
jgi:hypothetical protein